MLCRKYVEINARKLRLGAPLKRRTVDHKEFYYIGSTNTSCWSQFTMLSIFLKSILLVTFKIVIAYAPFINL